MRSKYYKLFISFVWLRAIINLQILSIQQNHFPCVCSLKNQADRGCKNVIKFLTCNDEQILQMCNLSGGQIFEYMQHWVSWQNDEENGVQLHVICLLPLLIYFIGIIYITLVSTFYFLVWAKLVGGLHVIQLR